MPSRLLTKKNQLPKKVEGVAKNQNNTSGIGANQNAQSTKSDKFKNIIDGPTVPILLVLGFLATAVVLSGQAFWINLSVSNPTPASIEPSDNGNWSAVPISRPAYGHLWTDSAAYDTNVSTWQAMHMRGGLVATIAVLLFILGNFIYVVLLQRKVDSEDDGQKKPALEFALSSQKRALFPFVCSIPVLAGVALWVAGNVNLLLLLLLFVVVFQRAWTTASVGTGADVPFTGGVAVLGLCVAYCATAVLLPMAAGVRPYVTAADMAAAEYALYAAVGYVIVHVTRDGDDSGDGDGNGSGDHTKSRWDLILYSSFLFVLAIFHTVVFTPASGEVEIIQSSPGLYTVLAMEYVWSVFLLVWAGGHAHKISKLDREQTCCGCEQLRFLVVVCTLILSAVLLAATGSMQAWHASRMHSVSAAASDSPTQAVCVLNPWLAEDDSLAATLPVSLANDVPMNADCCYMQIGYEMFMAAVLLIGAMHAVVRLVRAWSVHQTKQSSTPGHAEDAWYHHLVACGLVVVYCGLAVFMPGHYVVHLCIVLMACAVFKCMVGPEQTKALEGEFNQTPKVYSRELDVLERGLSPMLVVLLACHIIRCSEPLLNNYGPLVGSIDRAAWQVLILLLGGLWIIPNKRIEHSVDRLVYQQNILALVLLSLVMCGVEVVGQFSDWGALWLGIYVLILAAGLYLLGGVYNMRKDKKRTINV